jgi:hypothetical protein
MTDNWTLAADRIRSENEAKSADAAARAAEEQNEQYNERVSQQELDCAVADATRSLADFMEQRGDAAQELFKARGNRAHVIFGVEHDGGYYTSVYLHEDGLGMEDGYDGIAVAYNKELQKPPPVRPATPHDAAFHFAYYGMGRKDPVMVRNIVSWLTQQVDAIAAK